MMDELKLEKEIAKAFLNRKNGLLPGTFTIDISDEAKAYIKIIRLDNQSYNNVIIEIAKRVTG